MARVVPAYPHSSLNTIMLCSITAGRVRWNIARRVCVLASICVDVGFINLGLKRELRPVSSTSIIHDAFNKFCHKDSFHLHLMTQWLCGPTAAFITHTHSAMKAALWKPTRPPVLAQTLQNQCLHMEMFPLVGINLVQGWKKKNPSTTKQRGSENPQQEKFGEVLAWPWRASLRENSLPVFFGWRPFPVSYFAGIYKPPQTFWFGAVLISCGLECGTWTPGGLTNAAELYEHFLFSSTDI